VLVGEHAGTLSPDMSSGEKVRLLYELGDRAPAGSQERAACYAEAPRIQAEAVRVKVKTVRVRRPRRMGG
jgi:hypothetical protein